MTIQILSTQTLDHLLTIPISSEPPPIELTSPILSLLAATQRDLLARMITEHYYTPGEIIFKEGDGGDAMYIIRAGRVVVVKGTLQSPTVLGYRGVGEIIGEMALLENKPRFASVIAVEDLTLLRISHENFQQLRDNNPSLEISIATALSARLRAADEARSRGLLAEKWLSAQISELQTEKQQLLELQHLRQETSDFIVHDLRNPLALVTGALNMLEMVLPEDILQANHEIFALANINSQRMKRLLDSLLDIARMDAGDTALLLETLNLPDLINRGVARMNASLQSKSLRLATVIPAQLPTIEADEEKIDRVLANLIDNAIKFSPAAGQITIAVEPQAKQILVSVTNSGPVIPASDRERIFERFTQVSGNTLRTRGSGLGLAFCRLAVEAHGGQIWLEPDQSSEGNRFVFSLPLTN